MNDSTRSNHRKIDKGSQGSNSGPLQQSNGLNKRREGGVSLVTSPGGVPKPEKTAGEPLNINKYFTDIQGSDSDISNQSGTNRLVDTNKFKAKSVFEGGLTNKTFTNQGQQTQITQYRPNANLNLNQLNGQNRGPTLNMEPGQNQSQVKTNGTTTILIKNQNIPSYDRFRQEPEEEKLQIQQDTGRCRRDAYNNNDRNSVSPLLSSVRSGNSGKIKDSAIRIEKCVHGVVDMIKKEEHTNQLLEICLVAQELIAQDSGRYEGTVGSIVIKVINTLTHSMELVSSGVEASKKIQSMLGMKPHNNREVVLNIEETAGRLIKDLFREMWNLDTQDLYKLKEETEQAEQNEHIDNVVLAYVLSNTLLKKTH